MTLLGPAGSKSPNRLAPIDAEFLRVHGMLFFGECKERLQASMDKFIKQLDPYIEQWLDAGYYIGISLGCSLLGYGVESNVLMRAMPQKPEETEGVIEANPGDSFKQALGFTVRITETAMHRWGDTNILPFLHTMLVFVSHMTRFPAAISHIEGMFPWKLTSKMLNFLLASLGSGYEVHSDFRPLEKDQLPRPLPEDFAMRGLIYTENYFPHAWLDNDKTEECERYIELDSMTRERMNRLTTLGRRIAASGRWLTWNEETRSFTVSGKYETTVKDPPEPIKEDVKSDNDRPRSETLRPDPQYRLKLICVRLGMAQNDDLYFIYCSIFSCVANLEKRGENKKVDMEINEAIEELTKFWRSLDGSGNLDDSSSSCVFGCTYMIMGIQLKLKGSFALAASYEAEAKACFEKALRNSSQYAVPESTTGITINGYRTADLDTVADMNSTCDIAVSLAPPSEESFPCGLIEPNALEYDRDSSFAYSDSASTYGFGEDWILFPDFMGPCEHDGDLVGIGPHPCDAVHALSFLGASDKWMQNIENYVQRNLIERRSEARNGKIKRPLNAFMLYRMAFRDVAEQLYVTKDQQRVSKICGESWLQETKELRHDPA
ncbi:hypothetical protein MRS44_018177 [Fusarium solani]|uniref:uncharacterized protein n=1 Tax=Fusarium solani TaxID=169388 RepID=UPI0032C478A7|nr:hypothetical protein MRS44_018177 [Fusarium solani]